MGVITERSGHTLLVTIDRPEARNAIDQDTWDGLGDLLTDRTTIGPPA